MPKRRTDEYEEDGGFVEDGAAGERSSSKKKSRTGSRSAGNAVTSTDSKTDDQGDVYWELKTDGSRRVTLNKFKDATMLSLREYYQKDGKWLPGKKGISLPMEQFAPFMEVLPQILAQLKEMGENVPTPGFGAVTQVESGAKAQTGVFEEEGDSSDQDKKANFEATSEEEE